MLLAGLCKGSTADSDSVCEGSNPSPAATSSTLRCAAFLFSQTGFEPSPIPCTAGAGSGGRAAGSDPSPAAKQTVSPKCSISQGNELNPQGHYRYGTSKIAASHQNDDLRLFFVLLTKHIYLR